ncbi:hypothetical protein ACMUMQ_01375 [Marinomonas sp. 2405UD66-6]|uniref:hypothetical protein n=1 Tax=Marinomonas sp. 2405UD66-6 TaxID=3391834 RepID=UPI0039C9A95D
MKKLIQTGLAVAITAISIGVNAEPTVSYIEYAIGDMDHDSGSSDDYSSLALTFETPIVPLLSLELAEYGGTEISRIGVGDYIEVGSASYLYGLVHFNDYDPDFIDSDFSLTAGVNAQLTERLELRLSLSEYTGDDTDGLSNTKIGLAYYLAGNASLSANYANHDSFNVVSFSARLNF